MSQIKIYARVRPTAKPFQGLHVSPADNTIDINIGHFDSVQKRPESRYSHAPPSKHHFRFNHVFDEHASQEDVFDQVAQDMITSFLCGFNGTIFAYGQTSSGKTHTIEGNSRKFADRGLIPRTIARVFKEVEERCSGAEEECSVRVSYMEIYQDTGYDLLNAGMRPGALMVTLPKVIIDIVDRKTRHSFAIREFWAAYSKHPEVEQGLHITFLIWTAYTKSHPNLILHKNFVSCLLVQNYCFITLLYKIKAHELFMNVTFL